MAAVTSPQQLAETDAFRIRQLETLLTVDEAVAAILAVLEERGLTDNTLVLYTSDNGIMWQEHWWASKRAAYEESIRVPLVARYPALVGDPGGRPGPQSRPRADPG